MVKIGPKGYQKKEGSFQPVVTVIQERQGEGIVELSE